MMNPKILSQLSKTKTGYKFKRTQAKISQLEAWYIWQEAEDYFFGLFDSKRDFSGVGIQDMIPKGSGIRDADNILSAQAQEAGSQSNLDIDEIYYKLEQINHLRPIDVIKKLIFRQAYKKLLAQGGEDQYRKLPYEYRTQKKVLEALDDSLVDGLASVDEILEERQKMMDNLLIDWVRDNRDLVEQLEEDEDESEENDDLPAPKKRLIAILRKYKDKWDNEEAKEREEEEEQKLEEMSEAEEGDEESGEDEGEENENEDEEDEDYWDEEEESWDEEDGEGEEVESEDEGEDEESGEDEGEENENEDEEDEDYWDEEEESWDEERDRDDAIKAITITDRPTFDSLAEIFTGSDSVAELGSTTAPQGVETIPEDERMENAKGYEEAAEEFCSPFVDLLWRDPLPPSLARFEDVEQFDEKQRQGLRNTVLSYLQSLSWMLSTVNCIVSAVYGEKVSNLMISRQLELKDKCESWIKVTGPILKRAKIKMGPWFDGSWTPRDGEQTARAMVLWKHKEAPFLFDIRKTIVLVDQKDYPRGLSARDYSWGMSSRDQSKLMKTAVSNLVGVGMGVRHANKMTAWVVVLMEFIPPEGITWKPARKVQDLATWFEQQALLKKPFQVVKHRREGLKSSDVKV